MQSTISTAKNHIGNAMGMINNHNLRDYEKKSGDVRPLHEIREIQLTHMTRMLSDINKQMNLAQQELICLEKILIEPAKKESEENKATKLLSNIKAMIINN